jgi:glycosyltransferase involved in cell wall biosynthesis
VVIPCFRAGATIDRALRSVAAQTRPPDEIILVDDGSGDGSGRALHGLGQRYGRDTVTVIELPDNVGPGAARNIGWEESRGELVAFLDADDAWHPAKLEVQVPFMVARPELALTGTGSRTIRASDPVGAPDPIRVPVGDSATVVTRRSLLRTNPFFTSSVIVRRDVAHRFPTSRRFAEDYQLWLQLVLGGGEAMVLDAELAYRYKAAFGDGGLSGRLLAMERHELTTLRSVRKARLLTGPEYLATTVYSLAKYARRALVVSVR